MKKLSKNEYYHLLIQLEALSGNLKSSEKGKLEAKLEIMRALARFTVKK